jgi:Tol biopolymer transport system component
VLSRLELPVAGLAVAGVVASISGTGSAKPARCANDVFLSDQQPAWSPDGRRIAFVRQHRSTAEQRIRVVAPDGSGGRALTGCLAGGDLETELAWSRDGSDLLYESGGVIRLIRADGSGVRTIARGSQADWSPDGSRVAFTRRGSVYVVGRDGRGVRRLVTGESPDWSPDGTQIAFERDGVRVVAADGSGQRRIARGSNPAWSPKGDLIAAVEYVFGQPAVGYENPLVVFRPDGRGRRVLGRRESEFEIRVRWSPDGRRVGFGEYGISQIFEVAGARPRGLTVTAPEAEWSPDGAVLAISVLRHCHGSIAVLPLDSMRPRVITNKCAILGTSRADTLAGTRRADFIDGRAGNDQIRALGGTDRVFGNQGSDRADGGDGNDEVAGLGGNDVLLGAGGDDRLGDSENFSEFGNDRLDGGPGADELGGADGRDVLRGGRGRDTVEGGNGRDVLFGGRGDDWLTGAIWDADLGDDARDRFRCGPGYDRVRADRFDLVARDCEAVWIGMRRVRRR